MNISIAEQALVELGVDFTKKGEVLNVKLGGCSTKLKIAYNLSKKKLSYSYYQTLNIFISLFIVVTSMSSIGSKDYLMSGLILAVAIGIIISTVITEIKVTDLKRSIREYKM